MYLLILQVLSHLDDVMSDGNWSNRDAVNYLKSAMGCQNLDCPVTGSLPPYALDFDHIEPATKYMTKSGTREHLSDMVERYSWATVSLEIAKCRVLCRICHAERTHHQRKD